MGNIECAQKPQGGYGALSVSVFKSTAPDLTNVAPHSKESVYKDFLTPIESIPLAEFLKLGEQYQDVIETIRSTKDKGQRNQLKLRRLPAATISATFSSRGKDDILGNKLLHYNGLMVLDFDGVADIEDAKKRLADIPYIYYAGLSVSGKGLFAIVPIDTDDYRMHKVFFEALQEEMLQLGFVVDKACSDVTRLRVLSYDPAPYVNEDCEVFVLPDNDSINAPDPSEDEPEEMMGPETDTAGQVARYVDVWEKKEIPLDDYDDWRSMCMALSTLGEKAWAYVDRISKFSARYNREDNRKKFQEFVRSTRSIGLGTFFYKCHSYGVFPSDSPHYEMVPFPVEVFPEAVREIIYATHDCLNFPIDYIAPALLFTASVACGNAVTIEIKKGWTDKAIFYIAIVGDRGTNKSSCLAFALAPLREKDMQEYESYSKLKLQYDAEFRKPLRERDNALEEPTYCQTILSDFTSEVVVRQHKINRRGLAVYYDELMGFINNFNKYRSGSDEQMWTQLFTGSGIVVNRVSSEPVNIPDTCIGVIGTIQPEVLKDFARNKISSGFIDRWLFAYPDKVRYPELNDNEIDGKIPKEWSRIVSRILGIKYDGKSKVLRFSPEAKAAFYDWFNNLSHQKNNGSSSFAGMATKMERYCIRFSLVLEVIRYGCGESKLKEISLESVKGAISLCYYFIASAIKAHRKFTRNPLSGLTEKQLAIYNELPITFETGEGVEIAKSHKVSERTFKDWLKSDFFRHIKHGTYEKKYK